MNQLSTQSKSLGLLWRVLTLALGLSAAARAQTSVPAGQGLVADTTEVRVLRHLYHRTGGPSWNNRTNWLQGTGLADVATWAGVTVAGGDVTQLNLGLNNLQGPLLRDLSKLRGLQRLHLGRNFLTGPIPAEWGQLQQLTFLTLFHNRLSGAIPRQLGQMTALQELYLSNYASGAAGNNNVFTGGLPVELGLLANLSVLDVSCVPTLGGVVPPQLANLTNLTFFECDASNLTGALPAGFAQLPRLHTFLVYGNRFTSLPNFAAAPNRANLSVAAFDNQLGFGSLEPNFTGPGAFVTLGLEYVPQLPPPGTDTVFYVNNATLQLTRSMGGTRNRYQWERQNAATGQWADVAGATAATLSVPNATIAAQGLYRLRVTNDWVTGLTLYPKLVYAKWRCGPPVLTVSPAATVESGNSAVLTVSAAAPNAGVTFAWSPAAGLNRTGGPRVVATPAATTTYTVTATGPCATARTATRTVTVTVLPPPPLANAPVDACNVALVNAAPPPRTATAAADSVNFVRTWTPRVALTDTGAVRRGSKEQVQVKTEYVDGLGRPVQTVLRQESPAGNDIVQPVAYDALGRQSRDYLPYASRNATGAVGVYRPNALREQYDFYRQDPAATPPGPGNLFEHVAPTGVAYSEKAFEPSPLNRVLAQAAPGESWRLTPTGGHAVRRQERPNTLADAVPRLVPGYDPTPNALAYAGPYPAGELWVVETQDEHSNRTQEYQDKQGQVVAKRVESSAPGAASPTWLSTYYAYDDFGRKRTVIPPKAAVLMAAASPAWTVTAAAELLVFRYRFDGRGREIARQVPGQTGETCTVYDQLDRPVLTQDPAQRARQEWAFTKYDALGRPVLTGLVRRNASLATVQAEAAATAAQWETRTAANTPFPQGYTTDRAYPRLGQQSFADAQVLTATYYDDYDFDNDAAGTADAQYDTQLDARFAAGAAPRPDPRTTGLVTRTQTRVLSGPATAPGAWLTTTTFYDEKARPIQVQSTHARGGRDLVTSQLDFGGQVLQTVARHEGPNHAPVLVAEFFAYDHAGRLLSTRQQVLGADAQPVPVATLAYNEVGQLTQKTLSQGAARQAVDYRYNARGWLAKLNDPDNPTPGDLFGLSLHYDCGFQVPQFNGNVAGQKWRGRDGVERAYGYRYDGASRLLSGDYVARAGGSGALTGAWNAEQQRYRLSGVAYDENGNLLSLQRRGLWAHGARGMPAQFGPVDQLTYAYAGNRLLSVQDAVVSNAVPRPAGYNGAPTSLAGDFQEGGVRQGTEYYYDANGNQTQDRNKNITGIAYNLLNLPKRIAFGTGADSLVFRYAANGQKVAKLVYQTGKPLVRTDYLGPYQYEQDSLRFFPHAEGRTLRFVHPLSGAVSHRREFTVKDHLGNLRLAYRLGQRFAFAAGLEPVNAGKETRQFDSLSVSPPVAQLAGALARTGQYAAKLHAGGTAPQPLGPLKQVAVQKGDTVVVTAHGLYPQVASGSFAFSLASFVAGLLQPPPGAPAGGDGGGRRRHLPLLSIGVSAALPALAQPSGGVPLGYVRLLVFDKDSNFVSSQTQQLSSAALNNYEALRAQVVAPQDGYVTAYVGNESNADVYFDDVEVQHRQGLQVQENHYDPWGLALAGLTRLGAMPENKYQFNGKEQERELGLNWQDFNWRHYDPATARFFGVDRLAEKFVYLTPYQFASNNPTSKIELDGLEGTHFTNLFVEHVVMPLANYLNAYKNEATNVIEHNTDNGYTQHVPQQDRAAMQQGRTAQNTAQAVEAASDMVATYSTLVDGLGGAAIAAKAAVKPLATEVAQLGAAEIRATSSGRTPTMVAGAVDKTSGEIVVSTSGKPRPQLVSPLKEQAPNPSLKPWPCNNCAETKAANGLVKGGSEIKNIEYHTVRVRTGASEAPCANCQQTLRGATQTQ